MLGLRTSNNWKTFWGTKTTRPNKTKWGWKQVIPSICLLFSLHIIAKWLNNEYFNFILEERKTTRSVILITTTVEQEASKIEEGKEELKLLDWCTTEKFYKNLKWIWSHSHFIFNFILYLLNRFYSLSLTLGILLYRYKSLIF